MGVVPRSLRVFVRDVVVLLVIAFVVGGLLDAWATHVDDLALWRSEAAWLADARQHLLALGAAHESDEFPTPGAPSLDWGFVAKTAAGWAAGLAPWVAVCWVATRARTGLRTVLVPGTVAAVVVITRAVTALVPGVTGGLFLQYPELWPGVVTPVTLDGDGSLTSLAWHPGWAYPPLVIALLLAGSWLGARAGRLPDDRASRRIVPTGRGGRVLAALVLGLPAVSGASSAVIGDVLGTRGEGYPTTHSIVLELLAPLVTVVLAAALLSGTGPLGGALIVLVSAPVVVGPVLQWASLRAGAPVVAEAAGIAVLCAVMALWRPCAAWGAEILHPLLVPARPAGAVAPPPGDPDER